MTVGWDGMAFGSGCAGRSSSLFVLVFIGNVACPFRCRGVQSTEYGVVRGRIFELKMSNSLPSISKAWHP